MDREGYERLFQAAAEKAGPVPPGHGICISCWCARRIALHPSMRDGFGLCAECLLAMLTDLESDPG